MPVRGPYLKYHSGNMMAAIRACALARGKQIDKIAEKYKVPQTTLRSWFKKYLVAPFTELPYVKPGPQRALSIEEEKAIVSTVEDAQAAGKPFRASDIEEVVRAIVTQPGRTRKHRLVTIKKAAGTPGRKWFRGFKRAWPMIAKMKFQATDKFLIPSLEERMVFWNKYRELLAQKNADGSSKFHARNIWSVDETMAPAIGSLTASHNYIGSKRVKNRCVH